MKKLALHLSLAALVAGALFALTPSAHAAEESGDLDHINVTYRGGALLQHVEVSTLFMGKAWQGNTFPDYLNHFLQDLFADGRYLANLSQYSAGGYQIGNGSIVATAWDHSALPARVTDAQIRADIVAGVKAGVLAPVKADSLYVVFTAPGTVVVGSDGSDSENDFYGYHGYVTQSAIGGFAYAVIAYPDEQWRLTVTASHELAEAVTDPQVNAGTLGWYDDNNGEIGDIPASLYYAGRIAETDELDILVGEDGTKYLVQTEWSNQDEAPVAFAATAAARAPGFGIGG
jgi:hypothetical protein